MQKLLTVISWKYNPSSRHLKIVYSNGHKELYHPVPEFIYDNLLRRDDKAAFVHKYLEYNLHFTCSRSGRVYSSDSARSAFYHQHCTDRCGSADGRIS